MNDASDDLKVWGHFPVTEMQWRSIVEDSVISETWLEVKRVLLEVIHSEDGTSSLPLRAALVRWKAACEEVLWFKPPDWQRPEVDAVRAVAGKVLDAAKVLPQDSSAGCFELVDRVIRDIDADCERLTDVGVQDTLDDSRSELLLETFGIALTEGQDHPIDVGDALVAGTNHAHIELIARTLYGHLLPPEPDYVPDPRHALLSIWHAPRPLVAHRTAVATRDLLLSSLPARADELAAAYAPLMKRANYNRFAHQGVMQGLNALNFFDQDPDASLYLSASGFLDLVEVPLRLSAHALLTVLKGGRPPERPDMVGTQFIQLRDCRHPLGEALANLMQPKWRNAIAHRDLHWDSTSEGIVFEGQYVSWTTFSRTYQRAFSFHQGFEVGVKMARSGSPEFRRKLDATVGALVVALVDGRIRDCIAVSGNILREAKRKGSGFHLTIGPLDVTGFGHLCAGLADAVSIDESIDHWVVTATGYPEVLVITSASIHAMIHTCIRRANKPQLLVPFALAPVLAAINIGLGHSAEAVIIDTAQFSLAQALGHYDKLARQIRQGDSDALGDLSRVFRCLRLGAVGVQKLTERNDDRLGAVIRNLEAFEKRLDDIANGVDLAIFRFTEAIAALRTQQQELPSSPCERWPGITLS